MMSFGKGPAAFAGGGVSKTKIYGGIALAVLVAGGGSVARGLLPKPGIVSVSSLGIDNKKADPDKMLAAAVPYAKKWKGDAVFWSMTVQKLRADGTTDLSDTNVNIEFVSPSGVSSFIGSQRDDSIKKFNFIDGKMQFKDKWGVRERASSAPHGMPIPGCTAKKLAEKLVSMKIMKPEGVQATIDPHFSEGWLVQTGSIPKKFDIMTCAELK